MNKYKKITVLITICYFINFIFNATGESLILPKKKPLISTEKKAISELKSEILPLKKPKLEEKKTTKIEKKEIQNNKLGIIIPKNKPLIVRKQSTRITKKSNLYSDRDFEYTKQAV